MTNLLHAALRFSRTARARRFANVAGAAVSLAVAALAGRWFARVGFPLAGADAELTLAAGGCFVLAAATKAFGWSRLFAASHRPRAEMLAAAGGAAALAGIALPGRFDDALRVAVVRRFADSSATVGAIALSLFTLGLVDTTAMTPLASTAAASSGSVPLRVGLALVAAAGVGAAAFLLALPHLAGSARFARFRLSRWLHAQWPSTRQSALSLGSVLAAWLTRCAGMYLLLVALGLHISFVLAMVFMCAGAAAAALPVAPAGAVTQVGAGASVLLAAGVSLSEALTFAVAAQLVTMMVNAALLLAVGGVTLARRLRPAV
ncbi:MAG TPA: lysylphosphatidylglycerol synthase domain-containing protein [Gaiellaceae bacterium]|nr:lysylphosphatidylglycerol synthase domain-containing protein [Gaiellaceae bacterium]